MFTLLHWLGSAIATMERSSEITQASTYEHNFDFEFRSVTRKSQINSFSHIRVFISENYSQHAKLLTCTGRSATAIHITRWSSNIYNIPCLFRLSMGRRCRGCRSPLACRAFVDSQTSRRVRPFMRHSHSAVAHSSVILKPGRAKARRTTSYSTLGVQPSNCGTDSDACKCPDP